MRRCHGQPTNEINQVTAAVLTGPGGPHRRASVGLDTTPCFRYSGARAPDRYVFSFARRADFHLVINRPLPPARAGSADARDNLVSSTVSTLRSAVMRRVVARGQLEFVCPWRLAPSQPRQRRELRSPPPRSNASPPQIKFSLNHRYDLIDPPLKRAAGFRLLLVGRVRASCDADPA